MSTLESSPAVRWTERFRPRVWWWFAAAVLLHIAAWSAWFVIAAHHSVADVPLATSARH
jgi:hypothetical protein